MAWNKIWVIEIKIGENWCPIAGQVSGVDGAHYTRVDAREAKRKIKSTKPASVKFRVKKYTSV